MQRSRLFQAYHSRRTCCRFAPDREQACSYGLRPESTAQGAPHRASAQRAWEFGLPTICRGPAVDAEVSGVPGIPQSQDLLPLRARSRASVPPRPAARINSAGRAVFCFCPEGVGVRLADDLPGTGGECRALACSRHTAVAGLAAASRQIASKLAPTACGQNQQIYNRQQAYS
jgi:hypothetical protein